MLDLTTLVLSTVKFAGNVSNGMVVFLCVWPQELFILNVSILWKHLHSCVPSRGLLPDVVNQKRFSDNGTNFKGAQEEIQNAVTSLDGPAGSYAQSKGFIWHFHPPLGSHHGGHYERLIRSICETLLGVTTEQEMREDNLNTFFCEAEKNSK